MKQLCNKCQSYKKEVADYHFKSINKNHTLISLALCIECRDKVVEVLTTNETTRPALDKKEVENETHTRTVDSKV